MLPELVGRQSDVVYLPTAGHNVVLGTAGTGKTVMAILRALFLSLSTTDGGGRTLLVTHNNALASYLRHLRVGHVGTVKIETYSAFARGYLHARGKMPERHGVLDGNSQLNVVQSAVATARRTLTDPASQTFLDRETPFFKDELSWISGMGITDLPTYLAAERFGRAVGLPREHRERVWKVRDAYLAGRSSSGYLYDWDDIATAVRSELAADTTARHYRHVVIDEGQDLPPEKIRSLTEAVPTDGSVTFFGDFVQQIYGQGISWRSSGLVVPRGVKRFEDNYRNSAQVARVAIAMAAMPHLQLDAEDLVEPKAPTAAGPLPVIVKCADNATQRNLVQELARRLGATKPVAILARTWSLIDSITRGLPVTKLNDRTWTPNAGIYAGTFHSAKGLEFGAVILPYCDDDTIPLPRLVDAFGPDEAAARDARLLYVGITRPKAELIVTHVGNRTALLPTDLGLFSETTR